MSVPDSAAVWRYVLALVIWGAIVGTMALQYAVHSREAAIADFVKAMERD